MTTQHTENEIIGTGKTVTVTSPDQILISGRLRGGAVAGIHIKADMAVPMGVRLEINGTEGDLLLTGQTAPGKDPVGVQRADLLLSGAMGGTSEYLPMAVPSHYNRAPASVPTGPPFYTAQLLVRMAEAIASGVEATPNFADALALHRTLEAAQHASDQGFRVSLGP